MNKWRLINILFLFLIIPSGIQIVNGQSPIVFHHLFDKEGAPQSITYSIKQDSIGNIWIGTEEGLLKYDSKKFKLYNSYKGFPEIVSNRTTKVFIDSKQQLWIGLEKGVCLYDKQLDKFDLIGAPNRINPANIKAITEYENHHIWFGGYNGIWQLDDQFNLHQYAKKYKVQALLAYNKVLFFGTQKGLFTFDKTTSKISQIHLPTQENIKSILFVNNEILAGSQSGKIYKIDAYRFKADLLNISTKISKTITDIIIDPDFNYFVATDGEGLYWFNQNWQLINHFVEEANSPTSLSSNGIYDLELGKENYVWIATYGGGVNYFSLRAESFTNIQHLINVPNSLKSNFTRAIDVDKYGNLWFGTKKGISIWNPKKNTWKHLSLKNKSNTTSETIVLSLEPDDQYMWVGTYGNGVYKINIKNLKQSHLDKINLKKVYTILKDRKNNIWLGGIEGNLLVVRPDKTIDSYPISDVKTIIESKDGNIIVGCRDGVYKINDSLHQFKHLDSITPGNKLAFSKVNTIHETNDHRLILGTNGAGLIFYNTQTNQKNILDISKGLPSDIVQGILAINDQDLWVSTTKGLVHILTTGKDTIIRIYDKNDGMVSSEYNFGSYKKINDSLLAFGGTKGVTIFNPEKIKEVSYLPKIVFDGFKLSNKELKPGGKILKQNINNTKKIQLNHNQNSFEIKFTGISHHNPSQIKYSWKLEGFDKDWTTPGFANFATYTNLNPGKYIFKVKAFNKYSIPGEERQIEIDIKIPWWATKKAILLYILLTIGLFLLVIYVTSVIINKKNADEQIDFFNNITHEIKTPLAVLISTLDNITEKIDTDDKAKKQIKNTVNRISALFEQMLNFHRVTSEKDFNEEIHKLNIESVLNNILNNFNPLIKKNKLKVIINNKWGDQPFYFNKQALQKILENLIYNAIKYSFENGHIYINLHKNSKGELVAEIIDEGLGIPKDQQKFILKKYYRARNAINSQRPGTGLGLILVKKLIQKTGGQIKFVSKENKGSKFTVVLKNFDKQYKEHAITKTEPSQKQKEDPEETEALLNFTNSKILIVEDNDELRESLVKALSLYFQVYEASDGEQGLEIARQIHPDIILTDLIMPKMDGMQMAQIIKNDINLNHIPIFMLTVLNNQPQKLKSVEAGISYYFEKPVNMKYLLAKIINTLKYKQKLREKYIHEADLDKAKLNRDKNEQEFLEKLEKIVLDNIDNSNLSVYELAENMGMSRTSLYMKLKNLVDLSPQDFIIHTKLRMAKKLLVEGKLSIKEIAYRSGFSNPKYFSTVFKKFYKMSPSVFLKSLDKEK